MTRAEPTTEIRTVILRLRDGTPIGFILQQWWNGVGWVNIPMEVA